MLEWARTAPYGPSEAAAWNLWCVETRGREDRFWAHRAARPPLSGASRQAQTAPRGRWIIITTSGITSYRPARGRLSPGWPGTLPSHLTAFHGWSARSPQLAVFHVYFWNGSSWVQISGSGTRIAAGPGTDTQPWIVNSSNNIYHRNSNGSFTQLPGAGSDIGVDLTDTPWVIGTNTVSGGFEVYHFVGGIWQGDSNVGAIAITGGNQGFGSGCGPTFWTTPLPTILLNPPGNTESLLASYKSRIAWKLFHGL
jgi:hypothetical protein